MVEPASDRDTETYEGVEGAFERARLGDPGGDRLGCSYYEVPPGGQPWSYHYHAANEEAIYVLEGTATVELDGDMHELTAGDYLPCPAGPTGVHTIRNEGTETLRYLVMSTNDRPDVTVLPRREVFGVGLDEDAEGDVDAAGFYPLEAALED